MPFVLYLLGLAVFAQATSEFMLSGLGPPIAADLSVSLPTAGWLTSAFAAGLVVGAPAIAVLGRRWPRRATLVVTLTVFLVAHVVGALAGDFGVLLVTRVLAALANAGFLAVALATATALVPAGATGRATAVLIGGTTLACIAGVPAGTFLGQQLGWRSAFWAVALLCLPALAGILRWVPRQGTGPTAAGVRPTPRLVVLLMLGALVNGATFCSFTYLAPVVTGVTGFGEPWIPPLLALFGLGSFAGVALAGRYADRRRYGVLLLAGTGLLLGWVAFAVTAGVPAVVVVLVFGQGLLSFGVGSALIALALDAAEGSPVLAGGLATAALNVGAFLGPAAGGAGIALAGNRAPLWCSAVLVALALGLAAAGLVRAGRSASATVVDRPGRPAPGRRAPEGPG